MTVRTAELAPEQWPALEELFGAKGACGGCWCMAWRVPRGGKTWEAMKGEPARSAMKELVESGRAHGVLAWDGDSPVGWCSLGPRSHFPRLERVKAYRRDDSEGVWSVNCFFLPRTSRGKGLAQQLLSAAIEVCRRHGASAVEGYPVTLTKAGEKLPAAFAWMGPLPIFERLGFQIVQATPPAKPLVRLSLT